MYKKLNPNDQRGIIAIPLQAYRAQRFWEVKASRFRDIGT
jgi:hypothetical protein